MSHPAPPSSNGSHSGQSAASTTSTGGAPSLSSSSSSSGKKAALHTGAPTKKDKDKDKEKEKDRDAVAHRRSPPVGRRKASAGDPVDPSRPVPAAVSVTLDSIPSSSTSLVAPGSTSSEEDGTALRSLKTKTPKAIEKEKAARKDKAPKDARDRERSPKEKEKEKEKEKDNRKGSHKRPRPVKRLEDVVAAEPQPVTVPALAIGVVEEAGSSQPSTQPRSARKESRRLDEDKKPKKEKEKEKDKEKEREKEKGTKHHRSSDLHTVAASEAPTSVAPGAAVISLSTLVPEVTRASLRRRMEPPPLFRRFTCRVHYQCEFGQQVALAGSCPALGDWSPVLCPRMTWNQGHWWSLEVEYLPTQRCEFKLLIVQASGEGDCAVRWEARANHEVDAGNVDVDFQLTWKSDVDATEHVLRSAAFSDVLFPPAAESRCDGVGNGVTQLPPESTVPEAAVYFEVTALLVPRNHAVAVVGSGASLGSWAFATAPLLRHRGGGVWCGWVRPLPREAFPAEYKYAIVSTSDRNVYAWESGPNRVCSPLYPEQAGQVICLDGAFRFEGLPYRGAGVQVPLFSLRTQRGVGVGEYPDLRLLVDWCVRAGVQLVQLLPVNDTSVHGTWWDSYPYSSLSVFALHPIYISLVDLPNLPSNLAHRVDSLRGELDGAGQMLDYERTLRAKLDILRACFNTSRDAVMADAALAEFVTENSFWLPAYALFCTLRDSQGSSDFHRWPREYASISPAQVAELTAPGSALYTEVLFVYYVQHQCALQLRAASEYAAAKGVVLKGDLPIGVDPLSVDVWTYPSLFRSGTQAGAPPDAFSQDGQNWGFPTYNWEEMEKDNYQWWRRRLEVLSRYFHAYRIDHVLGFFRIWELPEDRVRGLLGYFYPSFPISSRDLEQCGLNQWRDLARPAVPRDEALAVLGAAGMARFLVPDAEDASILRFSDVFASEAAVDKEITADGAVLLGSREAAEAARAAMFRWLADVALVPMSPPADARAGVAYFAPRIRVEETRAYRQLQPHLQAALHALYIDYYFRRHEAFWGEAGRRKLLVLKAASRMMVCAEDLGMVPGCVHAVMDDLGLLGVRVQRMPRASDVEFDRCEDFQYLSVAAPSSHDTSTLRGWWREDVDSAQRFYNGVLLMPGRAPADATLEVVAAVLDDHLRSHSLFTVFVLPDLFALRSELRVEDVDSERVNQPAVRHHYWRYRLHISLEEMLTSYGYLADAFARMVSTSGRGTSYSALAH